MQFLTKSQSQLLVRIFQLQESSNYIDQKVPNTIFNVNEHTLRGTAIARPPGIFINKKEIIG